LATLEIGVRRVLLENKVLRDILVYEVKWAKKVIQGSKVFLDLMERKGTLVKREKLVTLVLLVPLAQQVLKVFRDLVEKEER
jgi:hypothetical protein